jgi:hypothetical protein
MNNITTGWKTTILGIILFLCGIGYVFYNTAPDYIIMSILLISGIAMLFFPDDIITRLKDIVKTKQI